MFLLLGKGHFDAKCYKRVNDEESELRYRHNNEKTFFKNLVKRVQNLLQ